MEPRGLLFDFDGTLYGDHKLWTSIIQETLQGFQVNVTEHDALQKARNMIGDGTFVNISGVAIALAQEEGVVNDQAVRTRFLEKFDTVMDATGPGERLVKLLDSFRQDKFRMGIVSFMRHPRLLRRLDLWKLSAYFDAIITPEQVPEFKPSPQPFLKAIKEIEVKPLNCFVIGDEPVDMTGGKKAGARTVGVPQGFYSADELREAGADFIITSISHLPSILDD